MDKVFTKTELEGYGTVLAVVGAGFGVIMARQLGVPDPVVTSLVIVGAELAGAYMYMDVKAAAVGALLGAFVKTQRVDQSLSLVAAVGAGELIAYYVLLGMKADTMFGG